MAKNALVLGGGGTVGVAWELGLMIGLEEKGFDPQQIDLLLGTSAGSFIGAMMMTGGDLSSYASNPQISEPASAGESRAEPNATTPDPIGIAQIFRIWTLAETLDQATRRQIGSLALEIAAAPENALDPWIANIDPSGGWPDRLRVTAVDAASGHFEVWGPNSGVPLLKAIAASCAVPGIFSPVRIGGRRYIDGGVRSGTSADILAREGVGEVLVVAPLSDDTGAGMGRIMRQCSEQEVAALEEEGIATHVIEPNDADRAAFGPNMMDASRQGPALEAGRERGLAAAEVLAQKLPSLAPG